MEVNMIGYKGMGYELEDKLVVAIASSALFDLSESDDVFRTQGEAAYRIYQRENETNILETEVVFPLIKRLFGLNSEERSVVEVVLFSRNDPDTGLRVFKSIEHYNLAISRAVFVTEAIASGLPAGYMEHREYIDDTDETLRIAFDFDGVTADDSSEKVYKAEDSLRKYLDHEKEHARKSLPEGPLYQFVKGISNIQKEELKKA